MDIGQLIKDVHENIHVDDKGYALDKQVAMVYSKLLSSIKAYREKKFANLNVLYSRYNFDFYEFRTGFSKQIKDTFEGELTEFLFLTFDLIGTIMDEYHYDFVDKITDSNRIFKHEIFSSIDEELNYLSVKLEHITGPIEDYSILLQELTESINRILDICRMKNIGIKTHIKLNYLYNFATS